MIRFFRNYQKTVFGILVFFAAALLMSSFGVNLASNKSSLADRPAIQVDDIKISRAEFQQKKRQVEAQYRKMFGNQYQKLVEQFGLNTTQNVIDGLVDSTLLKQVALKKGFAAGDNEVLEAIQKQFPGGYNREALLASGVTPESFLKDTQDQVITEQINALLRQASIPTKKEIADEYVKEETTYELESLLFTPQKFEDKVVTPTDDELKKYFDGHSSEFQTQPSVTFQYISFEPEKFFSGIEVPTEEIEFYYTENEKEFQVPPSVTARQIQLLFPKENDPKKLAETREKAQTVLEKAKSGENFDSLVKQYSDDMTTKFNGGLLGTVTKGKYKGDFDKKVFSLTAPGIADFVESEYGFQIVKVEKLNEATTKSLDEAKDTIIKKLKSEQAPGIADAAARELFDAFLTGEVSLDTLASQKGFKVEKQLKPSFEGETIAGAPTDFVKKIMANLPETKQLIEDKKTSLVVEVLDSKEAQIPELTLIKPAVITAYKKNKSYELAKNAADSALAQIKEGKSLAEVAKSLSLSIDKNSDIKRGLRKPPLDSEEAEDLVLSAETIPSTPQSLITNQDGTYTLARVVSKKVADANSATPEALKKVGENLNQDITRDLRKELLDNLKKKSKIDIDPSVIASGGNL